MPGDTTDGARRGGARCPVAVPTVNANAVETTATEATTNFMSDPSNVFRGLGRSDWISSIYAPLSIWPFAAHGKPPCFMATAPRCAVLPARFSAGAQGINSGHVGRREKAGG